MNFKINKVTGTKMKTIVERKKKLGAKLKHLKTLGVSWLPKWFHPWLDGLAHS
jgi:hypothetical protein